MNIGISVDGNAVQISSDGRTVWVNDATGCCIGRLGPAGIDVHRTGPEQMTVGASQCLDCAHDVPKEKMWDYFVNSMFLNHNVYVPERHRPGWSW